MTRHDYREDDPVAPRYPFCITLEAEPRPTYASTLAEALTVAHHLHDARPGVLVLVANEAAGELVLGWWLLEVPPVVPAGEDVLTADDVRSAFDAGGITAYTRDKLLAELEVSR